MKKCILAFCFFLLVFPGSVFSQNNYEVSSFEELTEVLSQAIHLRLNEFSIVFLDDYCPVSGLEPSFEEILIFEDVDWAWSVIQCDNPYDYWHIDTLSYTYDSEQNLLSLSLTYFATYEQEQELEQALKVILGQFRDLPVEEKVRAVHDWIIDHVEYDLTLSKYSAYDAFFSREAVCQGYSLLAYKMLSELGVDAAIVVGNMVRLCCDEVYYDEVFSCFSPHCSWFHLDVTMDDPSLGEPLYEYFLLSDAEITSDRIIIEDCYVPAFSSYKDWQEQCENLPVVNISVSGYSGQGERKFISTDSLTINLFLNPKTPGLKGDYFLWAEIPDGECYCYLYPIDWFPCSCFFPWPGYHGEIIPLNNFPVYSTSCDWLPQGDYVLFFVVDTEMDDIINFDASWATLSFSISPAE